MPKPVTLLEVFASCTQDLEAELGVLSKVIDELNPRLRDARGVELRLVTYGNFVVPLHGDPQAVINDQIENHCDIYIGMLGHKFGTPTPRAGSGTEEEFNLACERWRKAPEGSRVLFYFKNTPDVAVQELNLEQLAKVQEFRKRISTEQLYRDFRTTEDFLSLIREHLWSLIQHQWKDGHWTVPSATSLNQAASFAQNRIARAPLLLESSEELSNFEIPEDDETVGVLDALIEAQESIAAGFAALDKITTLTHEQNAKFEQHAKTINFVSAQHPNSPRHLKDAVDAAAHDLAEYAKNLRAAVPAFITAFSTGFESFDIAMVGWIEEKPNRDQINSIRELLNRGAPALRSSRDHVIGFRDIIASTPKLTLPLKKATRATRLRLDELITGLTVISDKMDSVSKRLLDATEPH